MIIAHISQIMRYVKHNGNGDGVGNDQDQELLLDQNRFGDHRTCAAWTCESGGRRNEMDEEYS
jgi:hypothetical protein